MTLFAAVTNTGNVFCWFLIYLEVHKKWKSEIRAEVDAFVESYSSTQTSAPFSPSAIAEALSRAGPDALDAATPTLDATLHETIRVVFNGFFMRRNIGGTSLNLDGRRIPHGSFLMFPTADLHFDPELFPDPYAFDPTRFTPDAVESRREHGISFLGWGAARHTCVGRRAALLMMKMITVVLLARFETGVVDDLGRPLMEVPKPRQDVLFKVSATLTKTLLTYSVRQ